MADDHYRMCSMPKYTLCFLLWCSTLSCQFIKDSLQCHSVWDFNVFFFFSALNAPFWDSIVYCSPFCLSRVFLRATCHNSHYMTGVKSKAVEYAMEHGNCTARRQFIADEVCLHNWWIQHDKLWIGCVPPSRNWRPESCHCLQIVYVYNIYYKLFNFYSFEELLIKFA